MHIHLRSGKTPTLHRAGLKANIFPMVSMVNTVVPLNKYNLASKINPFAVAIQVTEVIIMDRGRTVDSRVLGLLTTELMLPGDGVAISRTFNGLPVVGAEEGAKTISRKVGILRVHHANNSNRPFHRPLHYLMKTIIRSDLRKIYRSKTRVRRIMDPLQTARRWPLLEARQRKMVPNSALPSRPKLPLQQPQSQFLI